LVSSFAASACPVLSRAMKQASLASSMVQGHGKPRGGGSLAPHRQNQPSDQWPLLFRFRLHHVMVMMVMMVVVVVGGWHRFLLFVRKGGNGEAK
jgi:hypothetical protein